MCGCSKGNVRNFKIVLNSKNARQVQNGICLVVTKSMFYNEKNVFFSESKTISQKKNKRNAAIR